MKTNISYLALIALPVIFSCAKQSVTNVEAFHEDNASEVIVTKSEISMDETKYFVTPEMIQAFTNSKKNNTKAIISITSYPKNEEPALYVVNYEDGWSVFPVDARLGLSLIDNPTGALDLTEPTGNPGFDIWIEDIIWQNRAARNDLEAEFGMESAAIWDHFRSRPSQAKGGDAGSKSVRSYDTWCKIMVSDSTTVTILEDVGHLLQTKWGQSAPWNVSMPEIYGNRCVVGCAPVAVAQVIYYFHNIYCPTGLYHTISITGGTLYCYNSVYSIVPVISRSDFTYNSPRWADMPLLSTGGTSTGYQYVSDFMLDVGTRLNSEYGINATSTPVSSLNALNTSPCCLYGLWSQYQSSTDVDKILSSLVSQNHSPSIMTAQSYTDATYRHTWVIDGYRKTQTSISRTYAWYPQEMVPYGAEILEYKNINDLYAQYGSSVYVGMQDVENTVYSPETQLRMNWGWPSVNFDDNLYSTMVYSDWEGYSANKSFHYSLFTQEFLY